MEPPKIVETQGEPSPLVLRMVLNMGHILLLATLLTWTLLIRYYGSPYEHVFLVAVVQLFSGRAGGVGLGLNRGLSPLYMFFQVIAVDMILMLYIYPIFVKGYQHLTRVPVVGNYLANIHALALSHKKRMAPYGALGLIIFVIFPFWSTGCVVGAIVGYLIGLPTWLSLSSVTAGNIAAIAAWVLFYDRLKNWNESVALVFLIVILAVAAVALVIAKIRKRHHSEKMHEDANTPSEVMDEEENASDIVESPDPANSLNKADGEETNPMV